MSNEKHLPAASDRSNAIKLHDNGLRAGSLIEQSIARLNEQQAQNLMAKAAEEALRLEVKSREQNMDYVVGKKSAEDHVDTFNMLEKGGLTTRHKSVSDFKTGAGNMRIESKSGATCFVASVAYDDPNHPDVMFLRAYRDTVLKKSPLGRGFIAWYWRSGPRLARVVSRSSALKCASRYFISRIVKSLSS